MQFNGVNNKECFSSLVVRDVDTYGHVLEFRVLVDCNIA